MTQDQALSRTRDVLRRQHKALATERCYLHWLARYMRALAHIPAALPSEQKVERFLTELATTGGVSASTQNQAFNAILYFYRDVLGVTLANINALRATRPAHLRHARPCKHPRTGELVRYRMHESNVQQGVKEARRKLGIMVLPHELRHAYATHSLNRGVNVKALKEAMGHAQVETTIGYCHAEACSVPSPLEALT